MELREFVSSALGSIQQGVQDAITERQKIPGSVGKINPVWKDLPPGWHGYVQNVEFDVAVTASDAHSLDGKAGIKVIGIGLEGGGTKSTETTTVSRIKFIVPVVLPAELASADIS